MHLCQTGSDQERSHLAFRDWLRTHADDRAGYAALKQGLADQTDEANVASVFQYQAGKNDWIKALVERALREKP